MTAHERVARAIEFRGRALWTHFRPGSFGALRATCRTLHPKVAQAFVPASAPIGSPCYHEVLQELHRS